MGRGDTRGIDSGRTPVRLPELLAPAGGADALLAAVAAGADAVYLGTGAFDARAAAEGADLARLPALARVAHAHGARLYVTLNALVDSGDLPRAVERGLDALASGADALIVADPGIARCVLAVDPGAEIHLSTQAGAQSAEAVSLAVRELGVTRVTCARELSIPEIGELAATGVEIEAFCHGAICIGYSGACAFSALRRSRSAMVGDCTQPCRLSYRLEDAEGRLVSDERADKLLCPRDYLGIGHLAELCRAGVSALKIEGRMKNPDYVYNVVSTYRAALDALARGCESDSEELKRRLGRSFNRGFTDAYLRGRSGSELMSSERSCNQGVYVGHLVERGRGEVVVALTGPVGEGDVLEIRSTPGPDAPADVPERWPQVPCPRDAGAGERLVVRCKRKVEVGSPVHLVRSAEAIRACDGALEGMRRELEDARRAFGDGPRVPDRPSAEPPVRVRSVDHPAPAAGEGPRVPRVIAVAADAGSARALASSGLADEVAACAWCVLEDPAAWEGILPDITVILDEVARPGDGGDARRLAECAARVVCQNLGQIDIARAAGADFDVSAPVPCWNGDSVAWLGDLGASRVWLAEELSVRDAVDLTRLGAAGPAIAVRVFGHARLMTCEHCLLTEEGPCSGDCASCPRRGAVRYLVESDGSRLPVEVDRRGRTRIFDAAPSDRLAHVPELARAGVGALVVDVAREDPATMLDVLGRIRSMLSREE